MFDLPEKLTVWNAEKDAYGNSTYTAFVVDSRHADKQEKFTDKRGDQSISKAVFYFEDTRIGLDSFVFFGESAEPKPIQGANEVMAFSATPSYTSMRKGWV